MGYTERKISADAFVEVVADIKSPAEGLLAFIAISGFAGSGKSTLARRILESVDGAEVVPMDDFIAGPRHQRSHDWATFDRKRLRRDVLDVARAEVPLTYACFNSGEWVAGKDGKPRTMVPSRLLIIEGCGIIHPSLAPYYDYLAWIDCPPDVALERAKARDRAEGNSNDLLWDEVWGPNDRDYFNQFRPDQLVNAVVD